MGTREIRRFEDSTAEERLLTAAAEFLVEKGGKPVVIGGIRLQHTRGGLKADHELVIGWAGLLPEPMQAEVER
jgi:hypothetical protein